MRVSDYSRAARVDRALKEDTSGIEVYGTGRYLTVTGNQVPGTPQAILEAPRTLAHLTAVTEAAREAKKRKSNTNGDARAHGGDFFRRVNDVALANLDEWVPDVLPSAVKQATGAWRVTSKDLGRDYQEDLSIHPTGISDFGPEKGMTPIDLMIEYGGAPDATSAALRLCERMRIDPATLGWKQDRTHARSNGHTPHGEEAVAWPDPVALPHSLLPVAPFDYDMLPEKVRPWVKDVCERMQCPPDYVAVSVMAALGSVIGRRVTVRPQRADDWSVVANQWALCIGRPGVMKSPAMEEALQPVKMLAAAAREQFNLAKAEHDMKVAAAKARSKNADKEAAKILAKNKSADVGYLFESENIDEPTLKRYVTTNASVEALGVLLQQNPNGLLVHRDEMLSLLDRLDEEGHADERGFLPYGLERQLGLHVRPHWARARPARRRRLPIDARRHAAGAHLPVPRPGASRGSR